MISGKAKIEKLDQNEVVFRYDIDSIEPETVIITMTRDRWEKLCKEDTTMWIDIKFDHELPREG